MASGRLPILKGREVILALERAGFNVTGGTEHAKFRGPAGQIVIVPNHPGEDVKPGTLRNTLRQAGLTQEEFHRYL
ncbi:MAG TPA: type II toxin-antitoxin system HicA family toxin [Thermomicrobiales bacterium]|jgi:predicted RNA binding protein YcfA (HicA-like mRNA interferase family)